MAQRVDEVRPHAFAVQGVGDSVSLLINQFDAVLKVVPSFVVALLDFFVLGHIGLRVPCNFLELYLHLAREQIMLLDAAFDF